MSKYVKLDDLQEFCDHQIAHEITPNDFQRMNHLEIVRCKDCKKCDLPEEEPYENGYCSRCGYVEMEWFCADGERESTDNRME